MAMNSLHMSNNHTVFKHFLTTLMTSENNLEDEYENINDEVEDASNIMKKYLITYLFKIKC